MKTIQLDSTQTRRPVASHLAATTTLALLLALLASASCGGSQRGGALPPEEQVGRAYQEELPWHYERYANTLAMVRFDTERFTLFPDGEAREVARPTRGDATACELSLVSETDEMRVMRMQCDEHDEAAVYALEGYWVFTQTGLYLTQERPASVLEVESQPYALMSPARPQGSEFSSSLRAEGVLEEPREGEYCIEWDRSGRGEELVRYCFQEGVGLTDVRVIRTQDDGTAEEMHAIPVEGDAEGAESTED